VLLDAGRVVAEGTHEDLVRTSERYRDVLAHSAERSARRPSAPAVRGGES
jgi:ABC-type transport system involved in cytochrome bd biosynthesis fused ATPase/permease subunit